MVFVIPVETASFVESSSAFDVKDFVAILFRSLSAFLLLIICTYNDNQQVGQVVFYMWIIFIKRDKASRLVP